MIFFPSFSELLPAFFLFCQAEPFGKNKSLSQSVVITQRLLVSEKKNHPDERLCSRIHVNQACREYDLKGVFSSSLPSFLPSPYCF